MRTRLAAGLLTLASCQLAGGPVIGVSKRGLLYGWSAHARVVETTASVARVDHRAASLGVGQTLAGTPERRTLTYAGLGGAQFTRNPSETDASPEIRFGGVLELGMTYAGSIGPLAGISAGGSNGGQIFCGTRDQGTTFELLLGVRYAGQLEAVAMPAIGYAVFVPRSCGD